MKQIEISCFCIPRAKVKFWILTDKTLEIYDQSNKMKPQYYFWFEWSKVSIQVDNGKNSEQ